MPETSLTRHLAEQYEVTADRPFFPVNSLRLFYFLLTDYFTQGNAEVIEKVGSLIPKVEAVLAARTQHRTAVPAATAESDFQAVQDTVHEIYQVIDTPAIRAIFDRLFTYIYPLQDDLFINFYQTMTTEQTLSAQHLQLLLKTRAMDSLLFSTLICQMTNGVNTVSADSHPTFSPEQLRLSMDWHINLSYQLNDLIDAVVFAKEDIESDTFSLFQVIRRIAPESAGAKELIKNTLEDLRGKAPLFAFPDPLQSKVTQFYNELIEVVTAPK